MPAAFKSVEPGKSFALLAAFNDPHVPIQMHAAFVAIASSKAPGSRRLLSVYAVRLTGGPNTTSGRLEVSLSNGQWGTVCDDNWDSNPFNARVACRQLGLPWTGAVAKSNAYFGSNTALPILVDDVACGGGETTLDACPRRSDGSNNCGHSEDVGEWCRSNIYPLMRV